jgi:alpha-1,6-mannosyltransferase
MPTGQRGKRPRAPVPPRVGGAQKACCFLRKATADPERLDVKIVDVTEFYSQRGGGVRSHLTTRGHFLCQLGHEHLVIAPGPRDEDAPSSTSVAPPEGRARVVRIAGIALPYDRTYHLLVRFDKVRSLVRAEWPDVLEAHSPYVAAASVVACGRRSARIRTTFWHANHLETYVRPALGKVIGAAASTAATSRLSSGIGALLAPFDATFVAGIGQANLLRAAGVRRVVRVPFGVDVSTFSPLMRTAGRREELLGPYDVGTKSVVLLVGVGRFAVEKRWDVVLEAFARLRTRRNAVLVLFGDGPERQRLERRAPPGVRFLGFEQDRSRLASALASADVLVHGCPVETYGLAVAEAVASGLPVVVPDAGGAAENADALCSEIYRNLDAEACATAVERLLRRERSDLRARSLEAASRVPTLQQHFSQVLATYDELLKERASK